ncbi:hypothetical protein EDB92DRAFT_1957885 [Lactarius akahatsu]|uniref:Uncharacterized protein n=1 Tax=Lactarius akahatsu TaxID=416441 RepID=A0AAD4Q277_9AGAM|nr:hypothetical protein EDB92DRAFT_1957885 [Lactarius akahatsu]
MSPAHPTLITMTLRALTGISPTNERPPTPATVSTTIAPPILRSPSPLASLALRDERPDWAPLIDFFGNVEDMLTASHPPLSPDTLPSHVADDVNPNRGVKPSTVSVLAPRYPSIFPWHTLERPRDPDTVEPTIQHPVPPEEEPHREALVPLKHPLHMHAQKKCE